MQMAAAALSLLFLALCPFAAAGGNSKALPLYEINLDLDPSQRYVALFDTSVYPDFNATVWKFYEESFADNAALTDLLYGITAQRGPESEEQQAEIESLSSLSRLPLAFVHSIQMLYELQTVMVPIVNLTRPAGAEPAYDLPAGYEALKTLPWRHSAGCTGIIATTADGTVSHARNLDFAPVGIMKDLIFDARFTKGGKEVFRSQMVAGYTMVVTAAVLGGDGFAVERNTRYADHTGGFKLAMDNLLGGVPLNGWTLRKVLETETSYDAAIDAISNAK